MLEGRFGFFFVKWFGTCEIVWLGKFHRFETFGCEFSKRTAVMASQLIFFEEVNVNSRLPSKYKRSLLNVPNTIPLLLLLWSKGNRWRWVDGSHFCDGEYSGFFFAFFSSCIRSKGIFRVVFRFCIRAVLEFFKREFKLLFWFGLFIE